MTYILILTVFGLGGRLSTTTAQFGSEAACRQAGEAHDKITTPNARSYGAVFTCSPYNIVPEKRP